MIFNYKNGEVTKDKFLIVQEKITLNLNGHEYSLNDIPFIYNEKGDAYYLQQGMHLLLGKYTYGDTFNIVVFEQAIKNNKIEIVNIYSGTYISKDNLMLLRYYSTNKEKEIENIKSTTRETLNCLKFIEEKEIVYMENKIDVFFNIETQTENIELHKPWSNKNNGPFMYNGKTYESVTSFARDYKINQSTARRAFDVKMPIDDIVRKYSGNIGIGKGNKIKKNTTPKEVTYDGVVYPSMKSICNTFNINASTFFVNIKAGMSVDDIIHKYAKNREFVKKEREE